MQIHHDGCEVRGRLVVISEGHGVCLGVSCGPDIEVTLDETEVRAVQYALSQSGPQTGSLLTLET